MCFHYLLFISPVKECGHLKIFTERNVVPVFLDKFTKLPFPLSETRRFPSFEETWISFIRGCKRQVCWNCMKISQLSMYFSRFAIIYPPGNKLEFPSPKMFYSKFGWNCPSGSEKNENGLFKSPPTTKTETMNNGHKFRSEMLSWAISSCEPNTCSSSLLVKKDCILAHILKCICFMTIFTTFPSESCI